MRSERLAKLLIGSVGGKRGREGMIGSLWRFDRLGIIVLRSIRRASVGSIMSLLLLHMVSPHQSLSFTSF